MFLCIVTSHSLNPKILCSPKSCPLTSDALLIPYKKHHLHPSLFKPTLTFQFICPFNHFLYRWEATIGRKKLTHLFRSLTFSNSEEVERKITATTVAVGTRCQDRTRYGRAMRTKCIVGLLNLALIEKLRITLTGSIETVFLNLSDKLLLYLPVE